MVMIVEELTKRFRSDIENPHSSSELHPFFLVLLRMYTIVTTVATMSSPINKKVKRLGNSNAVGACGEGGNDSMVMVNGISKVMLCVDLRLSA